MRVGNPHKNKDYSTCHANNKIWLLLPLIILTEWGTPSQSTGNVDIFKELHNMCKNRREMLGFPLGPECSVTS